MAIKISQGFKRTSGEPIDETLALTFTQMKAIDDSGMPEKYFTICQDDGNLYLYNKNNTVDEQTGKFRLFQGGSGTDDYELLINLPKINNVELKGNKTLEDLGISGAEVFEINEVPNSNPRRYEKTWSVEELLNTYKEGKTIYIDLHHNYNEVEPPSEYERLYLVQTDDSENPDSKYIDKLYFSSVRPVGSNRFRGYEAWFQIYDETETYNIYEIDERINVPEVPSYVVGYNGYSGEASFKYVGGTDALTLNEVNEGLAIYSKDGNEETIFDMTLASKEYVDSQSGGSGTLSSGFGLTLNNNEISLTKCAVESVISNGYTKFYDKNEQGALFKPSENGMRYVYGDMGAETGEEIELVNKQYVDNKEPNAITNSEIDTIIFG